MNLEGLSAYCRSLPHVTEDVKWEHDLAFSIGRKIFAMIMLNPPFPVSFKCTPEEFAELIEREGIAPAAYVGRYHWVSLATVTTMKDAELKRRIESSYRLVKSKLPKKVLAALTQPEN